MAVDSRYEDGKFLVQITNDMLTQLHVPDRVTHWKDLNAHIFVTLFEGISGEPLRDVIRPMRTKEDEIHNVQVVIDTLSLDILHISLSHITGEDVVAANKRAIGNLMEVILGLLEFILEGIGSDVSSHSTEDTRELVEDPDLLTGEFIDEILERELNKKCNISEISQQSNHDGQKSGTLRSEDKSITGISPADRTGNSTADLIALGRTSMDDFSRMSNNNTADLVALGDSRLTQLSPPYHRPPTMQLYPRDPLLTSTSNAYSIPKDFTRQLVPDTKLRSDFTDPLAERDFGIHRIPTTVPPTDVSPTKTVSSQMDSSVASSVALPQHPAASGVPPSAEFASLGQRPRSSGMVNSLVSSGIAGGSSSMANGYSSGRIIGSSSAVVNGSALGGPSITHHLYHHFDKPTDRAGVNLPDFSSSLPLDNSGSRSCDGLPSHSNRIDGVSTLPVHSGRVGVRRPESTRPETLGGRAHSYDNLQNLMHDTVALSRAAVRTSPLRKSAKEPQPGSPTMHRLHRTSPDRLNTNSSNNEQASSKKAVTSRVGQRSLPSSSKSKDPTMPSSPKGICSPPSKDRVDKANKKVSFRVSRTSDHSQATSLKSDSTSSSKKKTSPSKSQSSRPRQTNTSPSSSTYPAPGTSVKQSKAMRSLFTMPARTDVKPQTFAEYLDKYYGLLDHRDRINCTEDGDDTAVSPHTDSAFEFSDASPGRADYSADADVSEEAEVDVLRKASHLQRTVRFDGIADDSAPGRMGTIRQKLSTESKKNRVKAQALARLYDMELGDFEEEIKEQLKSTRQKSRETERDYKKKILRNPKTNKYKTSKRPQTSVLRPRTRTRSTSLQTRARKSTISRGRKRSASASPAVGRRRLKSPVQMYDDDLLPWLLEEFPFLHLSKETLHELWSKSSRQLEQLTRAQQEIKRKKTKSQVQIEEACRKHTILKDIMTKELAHNQRMKELKERQSSQQSVRTQLHNRRMQSARARRYYDEFQIRNRSRMLKKKTREELIFKNLFKEGLEIQKDRIRDLRRYAKEDRERRAEREQNDLEAIENYYRDQFAMISEVINQERKDLEVKDHAQNKVIVQMKQELRQKMEREIRAFQEQLYRDEDEEYFRKLDADRLKHQLQLTRYQASV